MSALIAGLLLFLLPHSLRIYADGWRSRQVARMGPWPFKLAYSAVSIVGLILVVRGYATARTNTVVLWQAPAGAAHVTAALTVIGFVLVAAAYFPGTKIKAALGHPMTAGVGLWALGHLVANGRLAATILFGTFLAWAIVLFATRRRRDRAAGTTYPAGSFARDAIAIVVGIVVALVFAVFLHGPLIGVRPFG